MCGVTEIEFGQQWLLAKAGKESVMNGFVGRATKETAPGALDGSLGGGCLLARAFVKFQRMAVSIGPTFNFSYVSLKAHS